MSKLLFTITCGDQSENHHGMKKQGTLAEAGFTWEEFVRAIPIFKKWGGRCELYPLDLWIHPEENQALDFIPEASVLVIRGGVDAVLKSQGIHNVTSQMRIDELLSFDWDTQYFDVRRNRVLNKHARHNVCFDTNPQIADFPNKQGTLIAWDAVPITSSIRNGLPLFLGPKAHNLKGEGNKYMNVLKNGIGPHGDSERKKVAMWRIGASAYLCFRPHQNHHPIGRPLPLLLHDGDLLFMSQKAGGFDWKSHKNNLITWRHAAGAHKYLHSILS